jgi:putative ABC transport system permease protein
VNNDTVRIGVALPIVLVGIVLAAMAVSFWTRIGRPRDVLTAALRAALQLAAVSAVILFVLRSVWWTWLFLAAMTLVAAGTAARRVTGSLRPSSWWTVLPIVAGISPVLAVLLLSGVLPHAPAAILPAAGILIGNAMTATSVSGRRISSELETNWPVYEGLLALGIPAPRAVRFLGRPAAHLALVPGLDQTRTAGIVTLPGAFVGVLLGGGSPIQAGATQLVVLFGLLLVQAIVVGVTTELIAAGLLPAGSDGSADRASGGADEGLRRPGVHWFRKRGRSDDRAAEGRPRPGCRPR